jgi:hypothetical protein
VRIYVELPEIGPAHIQEAHRAGVAPFAASRRN